METRELPKGEVPLRAGNPVTGDTVQLRPGVTGAAKKTLTGAQEPRDRVRA